MGTPLLVHTPPTRLDSPSYYYFRNFVSYRPQTWSKVSCPRKKTQNERLAYQLRRKKVLFLHEGYKEFNWETVSFFAFCSLPTRMYAITSVELENKWTKVEHIGMGCLNILASRHMLHWKKIFYSLTEDYFQGKATCSDAARRRFTPMAAIQETNDTNSLDPWPLVWDDSLVLTHSSVRHLQHHLTSVSALTAFSLPSCSRCLRVLRSP